jgi:hypothetical protein
LAARKNFSSEEGENQASIMAERGRGNRNQNLLSLIHACAFRVHDIVHEWDKQGPREDSIFEPRGSQTDAPAIAQDKGLVGKTSAGVQFGVSLILYKRP